MLPHQEFAQVVHWMLNVVLELQELVVAETVQPVQLIRIVLTQRIIFANHIQKNLEFILECVWNVLLVLDVPQLQAIAN